MEESNLTKEISERLHKLEKRQKTDHVLLFVIVVLLTVALLVIAVAVFFTVKEAGNLYTQVKEFEPALKKLAEIAGQLNSDDADLLLENLKKIDPELLNSVLEQLKDLDPETVNSMISGLSSVISTLNGFFH